MSNQLETATRLHGDMREARKPFATSPRLSKEIQTGTLDEFQKAVENRWGIPCEAAFEWLAEENPDYLQLMIGRGDLPPSDLTFAAAAAGLMKSHFIARVTLTPLLTHESPIVREGALYGIVAHADESTIRAIEIMAEKDASPGVRAAAKYMLNRE